MLIVKSKRLTIAGFVLITALSSGNQADAQVKAPQITPLSPNSASLWKYAELPVNTFTGIPSISIPIYEIKSGSLTVPVTLTYHAAGIRYEEQASWVGLGWTLNAGGGIQRNIKGVADEDNEGLLNAVTQINYNAQSCDYSYFENAMNKVFDTEPDEFSYSLPTTTGRFVFKQGVQQPITIPYAPIKLGYTAVGLANLSITDENGTIYRFGETEITTGGTGIYVEDPFPSAWHVTQMQSADMARTINFSYTAGAGVVQRNTKSDYIRILDNVSGGGHQQSVCQPPNAQIFGAVTSNLSYSTTTKYLSTITFDNGKIEFIQSSGYRTDIASNQKSLEYIHIYSLRDGVYTLIKSIRFFYTYFKKLNNAVLQDHKLKLDKIQVLGSDASVQSETSFQYHTTNFSGDKNNANDFNAQDWWGFYNGQTTNTNMVPQQTITFYGSGGSSQVQIGGANRNVDPVYMTEGVLKRITYPTGGYTEFEFETHQFNESGLKYAGGLRVKKITSLTSANDVPLIKTYKYGIGGNGYGHRIFSNYLGYYASEDRQICIQTISFTGSYGYTDRIFNSLSSMQIDGYDGTPVVYPYVTEYVGTEITNNGRIEYVYDNGNPIGDNIYLPYIPVTNIYHRQANHYQRGKLTSKIVYNSANNKVSELINTYQTVHPVDELAGILIDQRFFLVNENPPGCYMEGSNYKYAFSVYPVRSGAVRPLTSTEKIYDPIDPGRYVINEASYVYDANYIVPTEINRTLRKLQTGYEEQVVEYVKFPFNYSFTGPPSGSEAQGIKLLQDKNISTAPVEKYTVRRWKDPTVWQTEITAGSITTYRSDRPHPDKLWEIETTSPISSASFGTGSTIVSNAFSKNAAYKEKLLHSGYDVYSNITQYSKSYDVNNVFMWDYFKMYPVAEIVNADTNNVAYSGFEAESKGYWAYTGTPSPDATAPTGKKAYTLNGSNNITRSGLSAGTTYLVSYWIKSGTPLVITGTQGSAVGGRTIGLWKYYEHKVTGQTTITITGSVAIDELRLHPVGALMTTYTYEPLIGMSGKCDPASKIIYYEYDVVGRLVIIRDQDRNIIKTYEYKYKTP